MEVNALKIASCAVALTLFCSGVNSEEIRDYYSEPGLNPFKASVSLDGIESVDPFGGTLQLHYTDIVIPGDGGMDIKIQRSYTSHQGTLDYGNVVGIGWTMHFGRIVVPHKDVEKVCLQSQTVSTIDNPSLELPGGGRELLAWNYDYNALITKTNWKVECSGNGFVAHNPDGTKYYIDHRGYAKEEVSWYTSKIVDKYGNSIDIEYTTVAGYAAISKVTASDGRQVNFEYADRYLSAISAGDQVWRYTYEPVDPDLCTVCLYSNLKEVIRPDGKRWSYDYNPGFPQNVPGNYSLKSVTSPYGGVTSYSYDYAYFDRSNTLVKTTVVSGKTTSGRAVESGSWKYEYFPWSISVDGSWRRLDRTLITGPSGKQEFIHYGYSYAAGVIDALWLVGLVRESTTYDLSGKVLLRKVYGWDKRKISDENFWHGRDDSIDLNTYASQQSFVWTSGNGTSGNNVFYENYDSYGNPGTVRAEPWMSNDPVLVKSNTYFNDTGNWRIGLLTKEVTDGIGTIDNVLNAHGDVEEENKYGVVTRFSYDSKGNLESKTDARGKKVSYFDYYRGVARKEVHPQGVEISKDVNASGDVIKVENGRGFSRNYEWTPLNELKSIRYPINSSVSVEYGNESKTLTRGGYSERVEYDGFGRPTKTSRQDARTGERIDIYKKYDAEGRMVFQSYPNTQIVGDSFEYDGLGRVTKKTHSDGTFTKTSYPYPVVEEYVDEVGRKLVKSYRAFGSPDNQRDLVMTESNINVTVIYRNLLGQMTRVYQGYLNPDDSMIYGYGRSFTYSNKYFLETEKHPEIGLITYGRDEVGNLVSKQVGDQPATYYSYDDFNRPVKVDYPGTTPDVLTAYNENGEVVSLSNGVSSISYEYDENDNLTQEVHEVDGKSYTVRYNLNSLDFTDSVVYPSGRVVTFNSDSYGRARQALPHLTGVEYHPSGQVKSIKYANGEETLYGLNSRLLVDKITTSGVSAAVDLGYEYFANGDLERISNPLASLPERQVKEMSYDALGRLTQVMSPLADHAESYEYDANGNIKARYVNGEIANAYTYQGMMLTQMLTPDWKYRWVSYDAYGNVQYLSTTDIAMTQLFYEARMKYDHAGNLVSGDGYKAYGQGEPGFGGTFTYAYDGHNKKVKEVNHTSGDVTHYVYASTGQLIGEYPDDPAYGKEYVYIGSQMVATIQENRLPQANPGVDQQVFSLASVQLTGAKSTDKDGTIKAYAWNQVSGPAVILQDADKQRPKFVAPSVEAITDLTFRLVVTDDDGESGEATVKVSVAPANKPPIANAGQDQTVGAGATVALSGVTSTDADGTIAKHQWTQTYGAAVSLVNAATANASFIAPTLTETATLGFELRVTDNHGDSGTDSVNVVVNEGIPPISTLASTKSRAKGVVSFLATVATNEAATTYFRVSGQGEVTAGGAASGDWQTYNGPVTVKLTAKGKASATFEYYSVDSVGNQEDIKSGVLQ